MNELFELVKGMKALWIVIYSLNHAMSSAALFRPLFLFCYPKVFYFSFVIQSFLKMILKCLKLVFLITEALLRMNQSVICRPHVNQCNHLHFKFSLFAIIWQEVLSIQFNPIYQLQNTTRSGTGSNWSQICIVSY